MPCSRNSRPSCSGDCCRVITVDPDADVLSVSDELSERDPALAQLMVPTVRFRASSRPVGRGSLLLPASVSVPHALWQRVALLHRDAARLAATPTVPWPVRGRAA